MSGRLLPLPAGARRGNAGSGPRQRVFTVSGEAVNSLGLIESRCCGFGLIHPPPPPPLDNVSLKPLCKLTAFLCAEHRAGRTGHGHAGGSQSAPGPLCCCQLWSPALILPRSRSRLQRTDPLVTRNSRAGWLRVVGCRKTQNCAGEAPEGSQERIQRAEVEKIKGNSLGAGKSKQ